MASRGAICKVLGEGWPLLLAQGLSDGVMPRCAGCDNSLGDAYATLPLQASAQWLYTGAAAFAC